MDERRLSDLIGGIEPPAAEDAEWRAWQTVREAHAELWPAEFEREEFAAHGSLADRWRKWRGSRSPHRSGRLGGRYGRLVSALATVALAAVVISPAGAEVRDWLGDNLRSEPAAPAASLTSLPGGGELLVESAQGSWLVGSNGSKRLLGSFFDPAWSPHGMFVVAADDEQLVALEPGGEVRWTLSRPRLVRLPTWNGPDGYRIAYLEGDDLRVVAGDGTGDRLVAEGVAPVRPAWRPGPAHVLAYALPDGRVRSVRADTGAAVFSVRPPGSSQIQGLEWSDDGERLLVWSPQRADLFGGRGERLWKFRPVPGSVVTSATLKPGKAGAVAIVAAGRRGTLTVTGPERPPRLLLSVRGELDGPQWSPDGSRLLVGWPSADQWLFLPAAGSGRVRAFSDIAAQFAPGATSPPGFPRLAGWCC